MKPEMVAPIDKRSSALELLDEEAEEMGLIWVVETLYTSFRYYAAIVGLARTVQPISQV